MSDFDRLLRPKSIAIIGGGAWCENVLRQCKKIGFSGDIWPVHPKKSEILGEKTYSSITALPSAPDAAFIGVNREATIDIVKDLNKAGTGGAICFASGFLEAKGESETAARLQEEIVNAAGEMKIIGPNCYGLINYLDGAVLWPDQHGGKRCHEGVAIVTQSSNIAINLTMQNRGLPLAYIVTAGNQAQTGLSEIGMALLDDPRVTALGLHIEGIDGPRQLERLAKKAHAMGKPIVALKVGKSDHAQAATVSHTASLAGSDAGAEALLDRLGIGRVKSLSSLLETLKLLHSTGPLKSGRIASMSCSGGEASLFADSAIGTNIDFPPLNASQTNGLRDALGSMVALANPLDYNTYLWGDGPAMARVFTAMMDCDLSLGCIIVDFPRSDRCSAADWDCVIEAALVTQAERGIPIALVASLPENMPEVVAEKIMDAGLIALCGMNEAIDAISIAAGFSRPDPAPVFLPREMPDATVLSEFEAKKMLSQFNVSSPKNSRAEGVARIENALSGLDFPVVLKGEGIAHKSDTGAVVLNLADINSTIAEAKSMKADSFFLEEMVIDGVCELLIGVVCDPAHGYVLTLAAGGILTEILRDQTNLLIPASRQAIHDALMSLNIAPLLTGYRGAPPADLDAVLDAVIGLQDLVLNHPIIEAEINPLICTTTQAIACDALIKIGQHS